MFFDKMLAEYLGLVW